MGTSRLDKVKQKRLANMRASEELMKAENPVEEIIKSASEEISSSTETPKNAEQTVPKKDNEEPVSAKAAPATAEPFAEASAAADLPEETKKEHPSVSTMGAIDNSFHITDAPCGTQSISIQLSQEALQYIMVKRAQAKMRIQDYVGMIIEKDREKMKDVTIDPFSIERPERTTNVKKTFIMTKDAIDYLRDISAMHGYTPSQYMNYMIKRLKQQEIGNI